MVYESMRFRVASEMHSAAIQRHLFELGYAWRSTGKVPKHLSSSFLYAHSDGSLTHGMDSNNFRGKPFQEMRATTVSRLEVERLDPVREKVIVFGKTYYKDDLDEALAKLTTVTTVTM